MSNLSCSQNMFQTLPDSAISTYAASLRDKGALVPALYKVIRENYSDVCTHESLIHLNIRLLMPDLLIFNQCLEVFFHVFSATVYLPCFWNRYIFIQPW